MDLLTDMTTKMMAVAKFAEMLHYPFKATERLMCQSDNMEGYDTNFKDFKVPKPLVGQQSLTHSTALSAFIILS